MKYIRQGLLVNIHTHMNPTMKEQTKALLKPLVKAKKVKTFDKEDFSKYIHDNLITQDVLGIT